MTLIDARCIEALTLLEEVTPRAANNPANFLEYAELADHISTMAVHSAGLDPERTGRGLFSLGTNQLARWDLTNAASTLKQAMILFETLPAPHKYALIAPTSTVLGEVYMRIGRLRDAKDAHERALNSMEHVAEPDLDTIVACVLNLVNVQRQLEEFGAAEQNAESALAMLEAIGDDTHDPRQGPARVALAQVQLETGRHQQAKANFERVRETYTAAYGDDDPIVAEVLMDLGECQRLQGDSIAAERSQRRAVEIFENAYGLDHPRVAAALTNLAIVLELGGNHDEAEESLDRAVSIFEKMGPMTPDLGTALLQLARLQRKTGRISQALSAASRSHDIFIAAYGATNLHTLEAERLLGDLDAQRRQ